MISTTNGRWLTFLQDDSGLSSVEYVVAGSLVVAVLAVGFTALGLTADNYLTVLTAAMDWE
ncbi:MAG: Flp family type IVb pilin [Vibrio sp.]|uniref:Flp family type IVb pilin n=1 Tax=Vibrio sp. TaxID=678 RepID=UPI003A8AF20D